MQRIQFKLEDFFSRVAAIILQNMFEKYYADQNGLRKITICTQTFITRKAKRGANKTCNFDYVV
jgi:hypothetical protein